MKSFYTNVQVHGSKIFYRGVENGKKVRVKTDYSPTLFVPSNKPTEFTTISGDYLATIQPGNIRDCRDFVKQYDGVDGFKIYGMQRYEYCYISDKFKDEIDWDKNHINICNIDIEVASENGFPEPADANETITAITMKCGDRFVVFGCGKFNNRRDDVWYIQCRDEIDLIKRFIEEWTLNYPDIITGWNVKGFDIPYLVNRIIRLMGEDEARRLSPWGVIRDREVTTFNRSYTVYELLGISTIDYIEIYRKYSPGGNSQESYKLDNIAHVELGERKLSYDEYGNLHTLYRDNYQLFIEYNIKDVELVEKLEDKLKLIELTLTLSYDNKCNYDDVFTQVRMWDVIIFNHLRKKKMVIPPNEKHNKNSAYEGAYVKEPLLGMHNWIASFDLNSLYPHLIMQYNISPETLLEPTKYGNAHRNIALRSNTCVDTLLEQEIDTTGLGDYALTPNGQFFDIRKQGFLPELMEAMYDGRSAYKKMAIDASKELQKEKDPEKRFEIEKRIARYNNIQLAKKVSLNSAYGALGNEYFRFFDIRQASAVTTAGQLSIRWIEKKLNEYMNKLLKTERQDYVIASDTDSIYLSLDRLVNNTIIEQDANSSTDDIIKFMDKICEARIQPFIDKTYNELAAYVNARSQKMIMKREALADRGIWVAKKRYILRVHNNEGVQYAKPKLKVMGLEMIKSSTPSACREKLWEAIDIIFNQNETALIKFIEEFRSEFKNNDIADIAFPRGVNGLKKYADEKSVYGKKCPIHVRGSLFYNHLLKKNRLDKKYESIKEGEKIKYIHLIEPNIIQSDVISFSNILPKEFNLHDFIDYDTQYDKSFVEPLKIILDSIGWKTEHVSNLMEFFS
jgi:DNA polymerase elongation subunit (family B)